MNKIPYQTNVGFADSEFRAFTMPKNRILSIYLNSWDGREIKMNFYNTLRFSFLPGDVISDFFEISDSQYLEDALNEYYIERPSNSLFKHYQLIDIEDFSFVEVVAEKVQVVKSEVLFNDFES